MTNFVAMSFRSFNFEKELILHDSNLLKQIELYKFVLLNVP